MQKLFATNAWLFPLIFAFGWFFITTMLSVISGWFFLMMQFPDRREEAIEVFRGRSASMRGVSLNGLLRIGVCPSGLRFGMNRLFGVFARDFFVPWHQLQVVSVTRFFMKATQLQFKSGTLIIGKINMRPEDVTRIGAAASGIGPPGMFLAPEANREFGKRLFAQWIFGTLLAGAFFTLGPRIAFFAMSPSNSAHGYIGHDSFPPWPVALLFPAIALGIASIGAYLRGRKK